MNIKYIYDKFNNLLKLHRIYIFYKLFIKFNYLIIYIII